MSLSPAMWRSALIGSILTFGISHMLIAHYNLGAVDDAFIIGAVGYHSDLRMVDPLGLITPSIAHKRMALGAGRAGHEKYDIDEVMKRRPSYILAVHVLTRFPVPRHELAATAWGQFNETLAQDPRVDEGYRYVVLPWGRWYLNMFVREDLPTPGPASRTEGNPATVTLREPRRRDSIGERR